MLLGRAEECAMVDGVLGQARAGASGVLVVAGEPGVGKSALLEYAVESASASGFQVVRASGTEWEMELAFAGLQQLCAPLLDGVAQLPGPQRAAIETAFGISAGVPPDPFFVGLGVLGLLSEAAAARPLLCVVDDVQWLDQASARALGVAARRLQADPVAVLLAGREPGELAAATGLAEVRLAGLADADARALLASVLPQWADQKLIDRIVAETAGNPLALLELPRGMTPAELAGGPGFGGTAGLPGRIEDSFRRRLELLPEPTRRLVLLAAADPAGDAALLWRACALAGIDPGAAGPAQDAGLVQVGTRVRFFHPLVRSAVFRAASAQERRAAHGLLAAATDAAADPGQRAWHRAQAAPGPDDQVAGELEDSAELARARGGVAAAAAFLERAAALTLDPQRRSARALAAAQAWHQVGGPDRAVELVEVAEAGPLGELGRAQAEWLRAQIIFVRTDGRDGTVQLLRAAQRLDPLDRDLARATYVDAMRAAFLSGDTLEAGRRLRALPLSQPPDATELLLHGYGLFVTEGFPHGLDVAAQAIDAFVSAPVTGDENIRALEAAASVARYLQDDAGFDVLTARGVALVRQAGALSLLPEALDYFAPCIASMPASWPTPRRRWMRQKRSGRRPAWSPASAAIRACWPRCATRSAPQPGTSSSCAGNRGSAASRAGRPCSSMRSRCCTTAWPATPKRWPPRSARASGTPGAGSARRWPSWSRPPCAATSRKWPRPRWRRCVRIPARRHRLGAGPRGPLAGPAGRRRTAAEELYTEAIRRLGRTRMRLPLARAHLLYGEWLRREHRRTDARAQLRTAHDLFEAMGARSFAGRARQELTATGATAHSRRNATLDELTPQEARIAQLAGEGLSNPEIAARLYISKGTVDYHLNKVFRKLGIRSRAQLHRALAPVPAHS